MIDLDGLGKEISRFLAGGIDPRIRYYETSDGRQFHYTTQRMGDGKFASAIYAPRGKGSRSGKGKFIELRLLREVHHSTRRAAKQRAYRLFRQHRARLEDRNAS